MARLFQQARRLAAVTALMVGSAASADAQNVLWWVDDNAGTNVIPGALTLLQASRPGLTFGTATDQTDFNTQLAGGGFDLVIFGEQQFPDTFDNSAAELGAYLLGGGRILGASWLNGAMATFFEAAAAGVNDMSVGGAGPLFAGITPPIGIIDPGWGVFAQGYSGAGACLATFSPSGDCAAIVGNGGNTLLLGPLFDTYGDVSQGEQFVANASDYLLGPAQTVPEPSTVALVAGGLVALAGAARRRARTLS